MLEIITNHPRFALALGIGLIATITDFRNRKIYDFITIPAIIGGIGLNVYLSLPFTVESILPILGIPAVAFGLSYGLYRLGQFGGGDVMLFTAISAFIPAYFFQVLVFTFLLILPTSLLLAAVKGEGEFTDREVEFPSAPLFAGAVLICQFTTVLVI